MIFLSEYYKDTTVTILIPDTVKLRYPENFDIRTKICPYIESNITQPITQPIYIYIITQPISTYIRYPDKNVRLSDHKNKMAAKRLLYKARRRPVIKKPVLA